MRLSPPAPIWVGRDAILTSAAALAAGACVGAVTVVSPRAALGLVLVAGVLALWAHSRAAGVAALWLLWLVMAGVRRIFGVIDSYVEADLLSLVPFVATAAVAALEFMRTDMSRRARRVIGLVAIGLCFGIPAAFSTPASALFALVAYGAALSAFVIGYSERPEGLGSFTLRRVMLFAAFPLAVYAISQYFFPLTRWDALWMDKADIASISYVGGGYHVRVFSTLNGPQVFGTVMALGVLFLISLRRLSARALILAGTVALALALTYSRTPLAATAAGMVAFGVATRGRAMPRVAGIMAACAATALVLSPVSPAAHSIVERATTFGALREDPSTEERSRTATELFPTALTTPLGHGLGSTSESTKLSGLGRERLKEQRQIGVDNGYLSIAWQTGPVGFALIIGAALWAFAVVARAAVGGAGYELKALLVSPLVLLFVNAAGSDVFYGVSGAILWYLLGKGMRLGDDRRALGVGSGAARLGGHGTAPGDRRTPVASWRGS